MARRRATHQDSLELLLDTICNTFGGVLFIAILVVLLLRQSSATPSVVTPTTTVSQAELEELASRMESVSLELERLRENRDSQESVVRSFAPEQLRTQLAERREVKSRQESLQQEVDQLLADNASLAADVKSIRAETAEIERRHDAAQTALAAAQAELKRERQSRTREVRMPIVRPSLGKREIGVVVRFGRVYLWHRYDQFGMQEGLNTDDFVVTAEEGGALVTQPKPWKGIPISNRPELIDELRQMLRHCPNTAGYLAIIVHPDSYGVFRIARDRFIDLGYQYRLMPIEAGEGVTDRGGKGGSVQ